MAWLGDLVVRLKAETADFRQDLGKASESAQSSFRSMERSYARTIGVLGASVSVAAFVAFTKDIIATRAALDDLADTTGDSVESLDGLRRQAAISGADFNSMGDSITKLAKNINNADEESAAASVALRSIGLSIGEIRRQKPGEAFETIARSLNRFEDGAAKVAIANALMGRSGAAMLPVMKDIAENGRLVGEITAEQAAQAERLEKNWNRVKLSFQDAAVVLANPLITSLDDLLKRLREIQNLFESGSWLKGASTLGGLLGNSGGFGALATGSNIGGKIGQWIWGDRSADPDKQREDALAAFRAGERGSHSAPKGKLKFDPEAESKRIESLNRDAENMRKVEEAARKLRMELAHLDDQRGVALLAELAQNYQEWFKNQELLDSGVANHVEQQQRLIDVQKDATRQTQEFIEQMQFETSLFGKSRSEVELLVAARHADLELRRAIAAIPVDENPFGAPDLTTMLAVMEAQERQKKALLAGIKERQVAEREWSFGAQQAIDDYVDHAGNAAEQSARLFSNAFRNMEDALVSFVQTGKLDFRSLANSIVADLIRIQVQQSLIAPIKNAGGLAGFFGQFGGGGAASGSAMQAGGDMAVVGAFASGTNYVPETGLALVHQGEQIIPAGEGRGGDMVIHMDNRGASVEAVQEAFRQIQRLRASMPGVAISAVVDQARSNPGFTRALRGA